MNIKALNEHYFLNFLADLQCRLIPQNYFIFKNKVFLAATTEGYV